MFSELSNEIKNILSMYCLIKYSRTCSLGEIFPQDNLILLYFKKLLLKGSYSMGQFRPFLLKGTWSGLFFNAKFHNFLTSYPIVWDIILFFKMWLKLPPLDGQWWSITIFLRHKECSSTKQSSLGKRKIII